MDEDSWALYARLQKQADAASINDTARALDEVLDNILDRIEAKKPMPSEKQLDAMIGNRRRKYRQRRALLATSTDNVPNDAVVAANQNVIQINAKTALNRLPDRDRAIILARGRGETYRDIAARLQCPIGSVKTWAYRARRTVMLGQGRRAA